MSVLQSSSRSGLAQRAALLQARARHMRHHATLSEALLWGALRGKRLGVAFKRQVVVESFIVDFLAPARALVIEIDGDAYHAHRLSADRRREEKLVRAGYTVVRLPASLVERRLKEAVARAQAVL